MNLYLLYVFFIKVNSIENGVMDILWFNMFLNQVHPFVTGLDSSKKTVFSRN